MYSEVDALAKTLDTALTRIADKSPDSRVIPQSYRSDIEAGIDIRSLNISFRKSAMYEEAVLFVRTVISQLRLLPVEAVPVDIEDSLKHLYRFVNGALREVRHKLDPETDSSPDYQALKRLQAEWKYLDEQLVFDNSETQRPP